MWCWHCCHSFEGTPLSLPYKYDEMRNKFSLMGSFCSWSCIKTFNLEKNGCNRGGIICCNIVIMRKKMYNITGPIQCAPTRYQLKEFGGPLTIEEFRKNRTIDTGPAAEIDLASKISPVIKLLTNTHDSMKLYQISDSTGTNEPLRLKRPKPLKRDENNLEKTLGITRKKVAAVNAVTKAT